MLASIGKLVSASAIAQLIAILAAPVLARLYSPEAFGSLGVFAAYVAILANVSSLKYEMAFAVTADDVGSAALLRLSIRLLFASTLLTGIAAWTFGEKLLVALDQAILIPYLWAIPVGVLATGFITIYMGLAVRDRSFSRMSLSKALQGFGTAGAQVVLGIAGGWPAGLIVGHIFGAVVAAIALFSKPAANGEGPGTRDPVSLFQVAARYRHYAIYSAPAALLNGITVHLPVILFSYFYGAAAAGTFFLAQRLINIPLNLLAATVQKVFMGEAAKQLREGKKIAPLFWSVVSRMLVVGTPAAVIVWLTAPELFAIVFGEEWRASGVFTQALTFYLLSRFLTTTVAVTLQILERQSWVLLLQLGLTAAMIVSIVVPPAAGASIEATVSSYGLAMAFGYSLYFAVVARLVHRR